MKLIIMAAALTLGGTAAAQTTDPQTGGIMDSVARDIVCAGITTVAADNSNPERDARGNLVRSANARAPDCYNQPPREVRVGEKLTIPDPYGKETALNLPPCTADLTDQCTQTYERGRRR